MQHVNERELSFRKGDSGPKYFFIGPRIDWGVLVLKHGETLGGHYHNEVEETFYFPEGGPVITINGQDITVKDGDVFRLEPHDEHDIRNMSQKPIKLIFIKSPSNPADKINLTQ